MIRVSYLKSGVKSRTRLLPSGRPPARLVEILRSLRKLTMVPAIGRRKTSEGIRKLVTPKFHYLVFYLIDARVVNTGTFNLNAKRRD
jgi:hypothetical protein